MRLVIVSGPYEGERLRRAAEAAGVSAVLVDASDLATAGEAWTPAERPDVVLLTSSLVAPAPEGLVERLRGLTGPDVPVLVLGDPEDADRSGRQADAFCVRPVGAEDLIAWVRERATGGGPAPRTGPGNLEPLRPQPLRGAAATPEGGGPVPARRVFERLAASIDETLDAEMLAVARTVSEPRPPLIQPAALGFASEPTRPAAVSWPDAGPTVARGAVPAGPHTLAALAPVPSPPPSAAGPLPQGELADADIPMLLGRAFAEALTGRLRVQRGPVEKALFFEAGRPVLATSNVTDDRMIEMLLRQRRITSAQHQQAVKIAAETGRRMGALLIDLGIMKTAELLPAVREHYEEIIFSIFSWDQGTWAFEPGVVADPRRIRLLRHPAALVNAGLQRAYPLVRMKARLGSGRNVFVVDASGSGAETLAELAAAAEERRIPALFDGVRSVDEIIRASGSGDEVVYRLALGLWVFRLLTPAAGAGKGLPLPRARDQAIERDRILGRHALVREGDYFQVLGVGRDAGTAEIRRAAERLSRELSVQGVGPDLEQELARELGSVREVIAEAARILGDETMRGRYREALPRVEKAPTAGATPSIG